MISPWPIFSKPLTQEEFESRKGTHLGNGHGRQPFVATVNLPAVPTVLRTKIDGAEKIRKSRREVEFR